MSGIAAVARLSWGRIQSVHKFCDEHVEISPLTLYLGDITRCILGILYKYVTFNWKDSIYMENRVLAHENMVL